MNMRATLVLASLLTSAGLLTACEEVPAPKNDAAPAAPAAAFDTPEAVVKAMIAAGSAMDKEGLSKVFAPEGSKEFQPFVTKEAKSEEYESFAKFVKDATVGEAKIEGDTAIVNVKFTKRDEKISCAKKDGRWWVVDF